MYQLKIEQKAIEAPAKMPRKNAERMPGALDRLAENHDRRDIDAVPLTNRPGYRLKVGSYRAIYERDDEIRLIAVFRIGHRKNIYQRLRGHHARPPDHHGQERQS